ncbi:lipoprotein, putative [Oceanicola granulosus HTCC2516]|uniref:Lipoprotein, putative n=1 Tax=Oceanicola granulosus (strain ATCC BAA-861 / DSM 15982 / KCTC 12143 / HTCC2516) TaxID=314256 RepID=Q2CEX2_OCEGH|nr:ABC-type transport auxiliary lipoprotein family protein [Oceanicola granulosus]EAR51238.1 lipoprotein, putative [Oceanicola granulosus HTCC2516]
MLLRTAILALILPLLAACGGGEERLFTTRPLPVESGDRVAIRFASVEVRDLSLPEYADSEAIYIRDADGALVAAPDLAWADIPTRAMTLEMARYLAQITGARVASEPWPFNGRADARLEVRVEEMVAELDGTFRLTGQYFVAPDDMDATGTAELFDVVVAIPAPGTAPAIAAARSAAVRTLARQIAQDM